MHLQYSAYKAIYSEEQTKLFVAPSAHIQLQLLLRSVDVIMYNSELGKL
jgi:hypothetical protein